jgi:tRNA(fMet)-specific endonuclease VapC
MMYFFDTNICIYFLKGIFPELQKKVLSAQPDKIKIPSMVAAELIYGARKSEKAAETTEKVKRFLKPLQIIPFDEEAAFFYGDIRASLEKDGNTIGFNDMIIAATVLAHNGTLVTNNNGEFSRISGLNIENWTEK